VANDLLVAAQPRDEVVKAAALAFTTILQIAFHALDAIVEVSRLHRLAAQV
jgi:hypothetical protein